MFRLILTADFAHSGDLYRPLFLADAKLGEEDRQRRMYGLPFALVRGAASVFTMDSLVRLPDRFTAGLRYAVRIQPRQSHCSRQILNATSNIGGLLLFILGGKVFGRRAL